jgi:hypothetical protein
MHERKNQVLSKIVRSKPMSAAALTSTTRSALGMLVQKEEQRTGSRMIAYSNIAERIGSSASWVRKFLKDSHEVKEPRITLFQNIRANYEALCNRVEQENREDERRLMLIKGEMNAVVEGFGAETGLEDQARAHEAAKIAVHTHPSDPPQ